MVYRVFRPQDGTSYTVTRKKGVIELTTKLEMSMQAIKQNEMTQSNKKNQFITVNKKKPMVIGKG